MVSSKKMFVVFGMCLVHTMLAMTENDWRAAEDEHAAMIRSGKLWNCECWNSTESQENQEIEVDCSCTGIGLTDVPRDLHPGLNTLTLSAIGMRTLRKDSLQPYRNTLQDLTLNGLKHLERIEVGVFRDLLQLRTIYISEVPLLRSLPAGIFEGVTPSLLSLRIMRTGLEHFPDLTGFPNNNIMHMIDLESNRIQEINSNSVRVKANHLILNYNNIQAVEGWAFNGSEVAKLSLKGNRKLTALSNDAFLGLNSINELDLSETAITHLPTGGLEGLDVLRIERTESLTVIPSVYSFKHLKEAWLTYSFHCCAFKFPARHDPARHALHEAYLAKMRETCHHDNPVLRAKRATTIWNDGLTSPSPVVLPHPWGPVFAHDEDFPFGPIAGGFSEGGFTGGFTGGFGSDQELSDDAGQRHEDLPDHGTFHQATVRLPTQLEALCGNLSSSSPQVVCHPEPDALNPCEDIMGFMWLRVSVWFVVITAMVGNLAVLLVLLTNVFDLTVPKFLMCNLAFADLCMGVYLLILASMDVHSSGVYFNFAYTWQIGAGCQVAGFLTVFASQLSIYTLSILTLERWFAITYAIYLNRRLKLHAAAKIMAGGWLYSLTMAVLPLLGISGYSTTSICLPMDTRDVEDIAYLITLLVMNGFAFIVICICYLQIYFSLDTRSGELTIAKKMALLIFTDFACWAPIAFFGLTAVAGYPLIDVTRSKILLVFFYPLNSCANPYLYAILTAQYRRDLFMLLAKYGICVQTAQQYKMTYSLATTNNSNPVPLVQRNVIVVTNTSAINGNATVTATNTLALNGNTRTFQGDQAEVFV